MKKLFTILLITIFASGCSATNNGNIEVQEDPNEIDIMQFLNSRKNQNPIVTEYSHQNNTIVFDNIKNEYKLTEDGDILYFEKQTERQTTIFTNNTKTNEIYLIYHSPENRYYIIINRITP